jgi:trigger factor
MSADVTDEEIDEAIKADLTNFAEQTDVTDRGAEYGDTLNINFKGFESGVAFEGGTAENYEMVLGQAGFIEGFEEQLVGHKVGDEFTIDVVFPEDYSENLAGKPAQFEIKMNSIKANNYPELTDEFVKTNFFCETVEDYRTQKKNELVASKALEVDNARKSLAYNTVYTNATIKAMSC